MIIEKLIREHLEDILNPIPVYLDIPPKPPDEFVVIDKTGSTLRNFFNSATIAVQSYAKSRYRAAEINEEVKDAMLSIVSHNEVAGCHLSSDYNFTNTETKRNRYQAVFEITHY